MVSATTLDDTIISGGVTTSITALQALLAPPSTASSQLAASKFLSTALSPPSTSTSTSTSSTPLTPSHLAATLPLLLKQQQHQAQTLERQFELSTSRTSQLVLQAKDTLAHLAQRTKESKTNHEALHDALIDHREALVSSVSASTTGTHEDQGDQGGTLRERLMAYSKRREQLKCVLQYFTVLAKAEELGLISLRALQDESLPGALSGYVQLVEYIRNIHDNAPALNLMTHLVGMASSVWSQLLKALSARLLQRLEALGWPQPIKEPLDDYDQATADFRASFTDLLILENIQTKHPLPSSSNSVTTQPARPLLALAPLVHPLLLRFRWHFDGDRNTNRIDKPEYPLSHVLNLLSAHDEFLSTEVQTLLDENGFEHVDAIIDFTTLLLPPLAARINHHMPQLLDMPPILAHTIFQILEFDAVLRSRNYLPRGQTSEDWKGLSELILGRKEWFDHWLSSEKTFFDERYYLAISSPDAWQVVPQDEYDPDSTDAQSETRPTVSALKVADLAHAITDRYRPLPIQHGLSFLFKVHLPLIATYAERITSSFDAFESLSFGLLPGALGTTTAATAGVGGLSRIVRSGISARWMGEKCLEWGEDAFFLELYENVKTQGVPYALELVAKDVLERSEGTLFDRERRTFEALADRAEDLIVKHVAREVLGELKAYLAKRWDYERPSSSLSTSTTITQEHDPDLSLSQELIAPLSLFTTMLKQLVSAYPPSTTTTLYRRISVSLSTSLYDRLLVNRAWSEAGALQLVHDVHNGFLQAGREAAIQRGVGKGWELLQGGARIMALPAATSTVGTTTPEYTFSKVMQIAFDDSEPEGEGTKFGIMMDQIGVGEVLGKPEVRQVMRRRPECWK
ncbi:BQ5605_C004g02822 [Microbotryum silenes-dioicae]|uniref:BQ5605_C004g02822 protein n=1 Tax=Microbotryum silenes-dioicae TaxID=796604 RepID=A0A2X0MW10_9BASI|nr:BQ5605_C004g02822 [Microbotryum silenes-dioicae]